MTEDSFNLFDEDLETPKKQKNFGFLLLFLLIALLAAYLVYSQNNQVRERNLIEQVRQNGSSGAAEVNKALTPFSTLMTELSTEACVQEILESPANKAAALEQFNKHLASNSDIQYLYLGAHDSQMFMRPDDELPSGYDPTGRPWYKDARSKNNLIWTDPYLDSSTSKMVSSIAIPITHGGSIVGVLGMDFSLEDALKAINGPIQEQHFSFLLDSQNNLITFPTDPNGMDMRMVGKRLQDQNLLDLITGGTQSDVIKLSLDLNSMASYPEGTPPDIIDTDKILDSPDLKKCVACVTPLMESGWKLVSVAW